MSDEIDPIEGTGITWKSQSLGPAPNKALEAFEQWWDANHQNLVFLDDSDIAHARAMFFACFLSGLSWSMHVPPTKSIPQYFYYRHKYKEGEPVNPDDQTGLSE